jgi:hypothetical protein
LTLILVKVEQLGFEFLNAHDPLPHQDSSSLTHPPLSITYRKR